ncbi:hypothetical protein GW17_00010184 [Ensete ventricosum]|nr:hypothetical protein GW17_00010184 [Ensete ventricosum]RZR96038.1 hypothetical protein BHM03_00024968 [Ensete ventricosum]
MDKINEKPQLAIVHSHLETASIFHGTNSCWISQGASVAWNIPVAFISVILLPIVGNAAEHASAIIFAMKDKLQTYVLGHFSWSCYWVIYTDIHVWGNKPVILFQEGTSNYFKGLMLMLCYLIVAASFFVHVDPPVGEFPIPKIPGEISFEFSIQISSFLQAKEQYQRQPT